MKIGDRTIFLFEDTFSEIWGQKKIFYFGDKCSEFGDTFSEILGQNNLLRYVIMMTRQPAFCITGFKLN